MGADDHRGLFTFHVNKTGTPSAVTPLQVPLPACRLVEVERAHRCITDIPRTTLFPETADGATGRHERLER